MEFVVIGLIILVPITGIVGMMIYKMVKIGNRLHSKFEIWQNR